MKNIAGRVSDQHVNIDCFPHAGGYDAIVFEHFQSPGQAIAFNAGRVERHDDIQFADAKTPALLPNN